MSDYVLYDRTVLSADVLPERAKHCDGAVNMPLLGLGHRSLRSSDLIDLIELIVGPVRLAL
jgi:hypothetical protein